MASEKTNILFTLLNSEGHESRFVGGCVRDSILGLPINDIDIATTRLPEETMHLLQQPHSIFTCIPTGIKHGTMTVLCDGETYEVTTLRKDIACDGRHAIVAFTNNFEEDALRRDFTINALSCDIFGQIYDYTNGLTDLKERIVRFIGNPLLRVQEDHLRILRFFRFHARFSQENTHHASLSTCLDNASLLHAIAGERIAQEMISLLQLKNPLPTLEIMHSLFPILFSQSCTLKHYKILEERDISSHVTLEILPYLRLAALIKSVTHPLEAVEFIKKRWHLSNKHHDFLSFIIKFSYPTSLMHQDLIHLKKLLCNVGFSHFTALLWLNTEDDIDAKSWLNHYHALIEYFSGWQIPTFPLNGRDIMEYFSISKGKMIKTLLDAGHAWWEDHDYAMSKKEILDYLAHQSYIFKDLHR